MTEKVPWLGLSRDERRCVHPWRGQAGKAGWDASEARSLEHYRF